MPVDRRDFLKTLTAGAGSCLVGSSVLARAESTSTAGTMSMLNDSTRCVGCRACQTACRDYYGFEATAPDTLYDMPSGLEANHYTVIKMYRNGKDYSFVKRQCMHCLHPACVSACPVRALSVQDSGAITYDKDRCIGCRYCMMACPFNVPRFEYDDPTPEIQKCSFCHDLLKEGESPVCVRACPTEAISFGTREEMLKEARTRIAAKSDTYLPHVYGEQEVGGTSVLYLSSVPFEKLGLESFDKQPLPELAESVQHGVFKWFAPPVGLLVLLGLIRVGCVKNGSLRESDKEEVADD